MEKIRLEEREVKLIGTEVSFTDIQMEVMKKLSDLGLENELEEFRTEVFEIDMFSINSRNELINIAQKYVTIK